MHAENVLSDKPPESHLVEGFLKKVVNKSWSNDRSEEEDDDPGKKRRQRADDFVRGDFRDGDRQQVQIRPGLPADFLAEQPRGVDWDFDSQCHQHREHAHGADIVGHLPVSPVP